MTYSLSLDVQRRARAPGHSNARGKMHAKNVGPRSAGAILVKMTLEERQRITATAAAARLPVSTFMRQAALGHQLENVIETDVMLVFVRMQGDLERLAGLLQTALNADTPGSGLASKASLREALDRTRALHARTVAMTDQVRTAIQQEGRP